jgi:hypothetical protein
MAKVCGQRFFFTKRHVYIFFWWVFLTVHIGRRSFDLYLPVLTRTTQEHYIALLQGSK